MFWANLSTFMDGEMKMFLSGKCVIWTTKRIGLSDWTNYCANNGEHLSSQFRLFVGSSFPVAWISLKAACNGGDWWFTDYFRVNYIVNCLPSYSAVLKAPLLPSALAFTLSRDSFPTTRRSFSRVNGSIRVLNLYLMSLQFLPAISHIILTKSLPEFTCLNNNRMASSQ